ncbi:hypothetical protein F9L07_22625 [Pimelobacter simplex]|uniref:Uncharacterized protein n=1 Tax=Nocardioides simplex TaxID=2045 RepID=A0A7J5DT37_NOCSI|nr:hypothetical protein [Pimelobacter simplex]KAB2808313.1 hypothetical protein F9L07_22625 [Pimelobacter simplex]
MSDPATDLVRVRVGDTEFNAGRSDAHRRGLTVLDEPTHTRSGNPRPETRAGGRPVKPKTSVATKAAAKKAASAASSAPAASSGDSPTTNPPSQED